MHFAVLDVEDGFCLPDLSSWSEHLRMWVPRAVHHPLGHLNEDLRNAVLMRRGSPDLTILRTWRTRDNYHKMNELHSFKFSEMFITLITCLYPGNPVTPV